MGPTLKSQVRRHVASAATVLTVLAIAVGCRCNASIGDNGYAGHSPMARAGAEVWTIDGTSYAVADSYYLALPEGMQFSLEYEVSADVDFAVMSDEQAYDMAYPLMRHVLDNRLYERADVSKLGEGVVPVSRVGVALFQREGSNTRGRRVARSLAEIEARAARGE